MLRSPDLAGRVLDGRYELIELIGEGTFGRVYRGRDLRLERAVAGKVIKPWGAEDPGWLRAFRRGGGTRSGSSVSHARRERWRASATRGSCRSTTWGRPPTRPTTWPS